MDTELQKIMNQLEQTRMRESSSRSPGTKMSNRRNEMKIQDEDAMIEYIEHSPNVPQSKKKFTMTNPLDSQGYNTLRNVKESPLSIMTSSKNMQKIPMYSPNVQMIPIFSPSNNSDRSSQLEAWRSERGQTILSHNLMAQR